MIKIISNKKGFSLIELMVVVVILGLIILGLVTFFTGGVRSWISGQSQLEAQRNARQAMDIMVREIREGKSYSSTTSSVTVLIPALGEDSPYSVTYRKTGNIIYREVNSVSVQLINNVQTLSFPPTDSSKVHVILEVDVDEDGNPDISLDTDVNLRNYGLGT